MCADCQRRAVTTPSAFSTAGSRDQPIIDTLPVIADSLDEASQAHFAGGHPALDAAGVPYVLNHRLVRGLDYYTRTTFEFTHGGLARRTPCSRRPLRRAERGHRRTQGAGHRLCHRRGPAGADAASRARPEFCQLKADGYIARWARR